TLVRQLREVMQVLATQPIEDISGVVEEKRDEIPSNEVAARIANTLSNPSHEFTARCRLGRQEHIIQAELLPFIDPELKRQRVEEQTEAIRLLNNQAGYTKKQEDVEREISDRQEELMKQMQ